MLCEELDAPADAPPHIGTVMVLRKARDGMDLEMMGLVAGKGGDERFVPPVE